MQETKRLENQLWSILVMPLYQKHKRNVNYTWIPNDYEAWLNNKEFANMLTFRGHLRRSSTWLKQRAADDTLKVIDLISKELKESN